MENRIPLERWTNRVSIMLEKKLNEVKEKCKRYQERVDHVKRDKAVWD